MTGSIMVEARRDSEGVIIKKYDVLRDIETGEMAIALYGENKAGVKGLGVQNSIIGINEWLDVYPDGVWTIVGNAAVSVGN